jgi:dihydrolipoamide dehydrogenase
VERKSYQVVVIGGGPGGYVAAIKAAQEGKQVCLVEKEFLGGVCLNVGCIPTKTLLANAELFHKIKMASSFGISTGPVSLNFEQVQTRKDQVIEKIRKGLKGLLASHGVTVLSGWGEFLSAKEIKVKGEDNVILSAESVILATGSSPLDIPAFPCDHQQIFNSTSILSLKKLPESIGIIGGGYIGCEFASLFAELEVKVFVIEALPTLVASQGKAVAEALQRAFAKKNISIQTQTSVERIEKKDGSVSIILKDKAPLEVEIALVAVGRSISTEGLGLGKAGVRLTERGAIAVNDKMETNVPGIYAIGDVTGQWMLAHVASHQGMIAALNAVGKEAKMHYQAVPSVIFTAPEIGTVGLTEEAALKQGYSITIGRFPFQALGKSIATAETEGFAQIIADKKTGLILGAQVVGHNASVLVAEMALAIQNELLLESVIDTIHAHPTVAEAWLEAALVGRETPIHLPPLKKDSRV